MANYKLCSKTNAVSSLSSLAPGPMLQWSIGPLGVSQVLFLLRQDQLGFAKNHANTYSKPVQKLICLSHTYIIILRSLL